MNASIHNYSFSISCSPGCLVVVFSSSLLGEKKAIKTGQKQDGRTQEEYLQKEGKKREHEGSLAASAAEGILTALGYS